MPKKSKKKFITICPKCNSIDVSADFSNPALVSTGLFNNAKVCHNCGYSANFFPEVEADNLPEVKVLKKKEKIDLVNTTYGKNINWWWKISGPIGLIISIVLLLFYNVPSLFYFSLIILFPLSIIITLTSYKNELIQKYKILRILSFIVYIYSFTIGPAIYVMLIYNK